MTALLSMTESTSGCGMQDNEAVAIECVACVSPVDRFSPLMVDAGERKRRRQKQRFPSQNIRRSRARFSVSPEKRHKLPLHWTGEIKSDQFPPSAVVVNGCGLRSSIFWQLKRTMKIESHRYLSADGRALVNRKENAAATWKKKKRGKEQEQQTEIRANQNEITTDSKPDEQFIKMSSWLIFHLSFAFS